ncbi:MAG: 3-hydroxyacyl-ACP dehydratase [Bacteroidales bacterium]|nr:3-hydroxyacyl-ACP dehydratase [Bacteroidales bacterium]
MLKGTFFRIEQITENKSDSLPGTPTSSYCIGISLDPDHSLYEGHFPGNPVVPGVCQIRMITEIVSEIRGKEVRLVEADNIKFLSMINPKDHPQLTVDCTIKENEEGIIRVTASLSDHEQVFFKYKSIFA